MTTQWVAAEMRTGDVIDDLPSFDADGALRTSLSNYDSGNGTLHLDGASPKTWQRAVKPGGSWLACYDDEDPSHPIQWCGYVSTRGRATASNDVPVSLTTAGGYLDRIYVPDRFYAAASWNRNAIVADLINTLIVEQPGRKGIPLQLDYTGTGPTPKADYVWQNTDNVTVLGRMQYLFGELGGEWFIDWDWADDGNTIVPTIRFGDRIGDQAVPGLGPKATFEFPGSLMDLKETLDYTDGKGANSITGYSTPPDNATVVPVAAPVYVDDPDRPLFEFRYQPAPLLTTDQCRSFAQIASQILGPGSTSYELTVSREDLDTRRYGVDYGMGDDIGMVVHEADVDGRPVLAFPGGLDTTGRLIAYELTDASTVTPVLAQPTFVQTDNANQVIT
jgi:hypothetical protein